MTAAPFYLRFLERWENSWRVGGWVGGVFWQWSREKKIGYESNLGLCDYTFRLPVTLLAFLGRHAVYIVIR